MKSLEQGSLALVNYIPDPLGAFLHTLRRLLPGEEDPQPHITILPPRPVKVSMESASLHARKILDDFSSFEVELSSVRCFPDTSYLYLDIAEGNRTLHQLHEALNAGELSHEEKFAYRPHLTLGGPVDAAALSSVQEQAEHAWRTNGSPRRFVVDEIVCLWLRPEGDSSEWRRLWSHWLSGRTGRGAAAGPH